MIDKIIEELEKEISDLLMAYFYNPDFSCSSEKLKNMVIKEINQFSTKLKQCIEKEYIRRLEASLIIKNLNEGWEKAIEKDTIPKSRVEECINEIKEEGTIPASFRNIIINKLQSLLNPKQEAGE